MRTPLGDRFERGVMARSAASEPEAHQELEDWTRSGDGISHKRSLWTAPKCEVPSGVSDGQPMWKPLSITQGDGTSVQPEGIDRQSLLSAQMRETGSNVASFTQSVEEDPRSSAERTKDDLSEIWGEELLGLKSENASDHGRQNVIGKPNGRCSKLGRCRRDTRDDDGT